MDPELARGYVRDPRRVDRAAIRPATTSTTRNAAATTRSSSRSSARSPRKIATIPPASRSMIVFHNAWQYYDDRFGLRTIGVLELSPGQEPNPQVHRAPDQRSRKSNHVRRFSPSPSTAPSSSTRSPRARDLDGRNLYDDSIGQRSARARLREHAALRHGDDRHALWAAVP
jgi:hypothetical protein